MLRQPTPRQQPRDPEPAQPTGPEADGLSPTTEPDEAGQTPPPTLPSGWIVPVLVV